MKKTTKTRRESKKAWIKVYLLQSQLVFQSLTLFKKNYFFFDQIATHLGSQIISRSMYVILAFPQNKMSPR